MRAETLTAMPPVRAARTWLTWATSFGLPRAALRAEARRGSLLARLEVDPALREDPFAAYDELRDQGPVVRGRLTAATAHHAVATEVLRSPAFGVAGEHGELPVPAQRLLARLQDPWSLGPVDPPSMLATDPPAHTRYRKLVVREFTARAAHGLEPRIRALTEPLLDRLEQDRARGATDVDLVDRFAARLPVAVIAEVLGVPDDMHERLLEWGNGAALYLDPALSWAQYRYAESGMRQLHAWFDGHLAALRRDPGDDLLSRLVVLEEDERLTDLELHATGLLVLGAGFETTVNLLGNAVQLLSAHPDQRALLAEDPTLWENAVEEVLRIDSPVQLTRRLAREDTEVGGDSLRAGHAMLVMIGGANRDPAVFEDPHTFDVRRPNADQHLAFSSGPHYCLGASLARREAVVALSALYERFPDLVVDGRPVRRGTRVLRGYERLPVSLGRAAVGGVAGEVCSPA